MLVSESGIRTRSDVERLEAAGVSAILVGETLMRAVDIGLAVERLLGLTPEPEGETALERPRRMPRQARPRPHQVTNHKASTTMTDDIFDSPAARSTKLIGTSVMAAPSSLDR